MRRRGEVAFVPAAAAEAGLDQPLQIYPGKRPAHLFSHLAAQGLLGFQKFFAADLAAGVAFA